MVKSLYSNFSSVLDGMREITEHVGDSAKRNLNWGYVSFGFSKNVKYIYVVICHSCASYMIASILVEQWLPGVLGWPLSETEVKGNRLHLSVNTYFSTQYQ